MTFGQKVTKLRVDANITQPMLANKLGVSVETVRAWEADQACPSGALLAALASHLWSSPEELTREG